MVSGRGERHRQSRKVVPSNASTTAIPRLRRHLIEPFCLIGSKPPLEFFAVSATDDDSCLTKRTTSSYCSRGLQHHDGPFRSAQRTIFALGGLTNLHSPWVMSRLTS